MQQALIAYLEDVRNDEFPRMRKGEAIEQQSALEHPFVGTLSVKTEAYTHVVEIWQQQEGHE